MEDLTGKQFDAYRVVSPLGEGGMASVYKAYQPSVDRYVALKVLSRFYTTEPQFITRFTHEAKLVASLQHPHILSVFDFGQADGYTYLVMPFVNGGTLAQLLKGGRQPLTLVERVMSQISGALDYAHGKGIVHRDIKPSNILIDEGGNCLVADFGLARMAENTAQLTATGTVMGTPAYMSPEQAGGGEIGPWSDVYSVGIVLYEMLTGRVPFQAETPIAVAIKHLNDPLPPPRSIAPELSPEIEAVVLKALARSRSDRFATCGAMMTALSAALGPMRHASAIVTPASGADVTARIPGVLPLPSPPPTAEPADRASEKKAGLGAWLAAAAAIAVLAGAGYFLLGRPSVAPATVVAPAAPDAAPAAASTPPPPAAPAVLAPAPVAVAATPAAAAAAPAKTDASPAAVPSPAADAPAAAAGRGGRGRNTPPGMADLAAGRRAFNTQRFDDAFVSYGKSADAGNPDAMVQLAALFATGRGTSRNINAAFTWYERAANAGNVFAMQSMGDIYTVNTRGTRRDLTKARAWYEKAAAAGSEVAKHRLETLPD